MTDRPPPESRHVRATPVAALAIAAATGIGAGWLLRPLAQMLTNASPVVTWVQVLALFLGAAILGAAAWSTWRSVHVNRLRLEPHRAVNRLVLAKACALVGALTAGGYAGYAIAWLGMEAELAGQRVLRSAVAAVAGALVCVAALLLERACRVPGGDTDA